MRAPEEAGMPDDVRDEWTRALRLSWITIAYLVSACVVVGITMGTSQAMKTAWFDDLLSLLPPASFLVSSRVAHRAPNERFPFGYHRAATIAYLAGALALAAMGVYLAIDSLFALVSREHPTIQSVRVLGRDVWLGWLMLAALAWSGIPAVFLGRAKQPIAEKLHDKGLLSDANMNRADWITAAAACAGIVGIALGAWWADAVAGMVIAVEITRDGVENVRRAVHDLMDRVPVRIDGTEADPVCARIAEELGRCDWIADAQIRLREQGHLIVGEVLVVPTRTDDLVARADGIRQRIRELDWRLHDIVVAAVPSVPRRGDGAQTARGGGERSRVECT